MAEPGCASARRHPAMCSTISSSAILSTSRCRSLPPHEAYLPCSSPRCVHLRLCVDLATRERHNRLAGHAGYERLSAARARTRVIEAPQAHGRHELSRHGADPAVVPQRHHRLCQLSLVWCARGLGDEITFGVPSPVKRLRWARVEARHLPFDIGAATLRGR